MTKFKEYGFLGDNGMVWAVTTEPQTPKVLARVLLKIKMREEGLKLSKEGILSFLEGWAESMTECSDGEAEYSADGIADYVSDMLVSCNMHIIEYSNQTQIGNSMRDKIGNELTNLLEA